MNRIVTMVLKNLWHVPGAWFKLCHYAKHTEKYTELEQWQHIQYILRLAVKGGNIDLKITGLENISELNVTARLAYRGDTIVNIPGTTQTITK